MCIQVLICSNEWEGTCPARMATLLHNYSITENFGNTSIPWHRGCLWFQNISTKGANFGNHCLIINLKDSLSRISMLQYNPSVWTYNQISWEKIFHSTFYTFLLSLNIRNDDTALFYWRWYEIWDKTRQKAIREEKRVERETKKNNRMENGWLYTSLNPKITQNNNFCMTVIQILF